MAGVFCLARRRPRYPRIRAFYVHPRWSRRGIGRRIAQACEEAARSAGFRTLELIATLPGEPLYLALGYSIVEPFEISLPDGQSLPASRMEKSLASLEVPQTTIK